MRRYGKDQKRPLTEAHPNSFTPRKRLITDHFAFNRETTLQSHPSSSQQSTNDVPKKVQTFLDLGQQGFLFKECRECGMRYDSSFDSEVRLHDKFHRFHTAGMIVKCDKGYVIGRRSEFTAIVIPRSRREEIMELVNNELNAVDLVGDEHVYGVVDGNGKLCSVAIIEPDPERLLVSRIWTKTDLRRRGLATFLVDRILVYEEKGKTKVQFSSPTSLGVQFGRAYTESEDIRVYDKR